jgi:hypothetical protein
MGTSIVTVCLAVCRYVAMSKYILSNLGKVIPQKRRRLRVATKAFALGSHGVGRYWFGGLSLLRVGFLCSSLIRPVTANRASCGSANYTMVPCDMTSHTPYSGSL